MKPDRYRFTEVKGLTIAFVSGLELAGSSTLVRLGATSSRIAALEEELNAEKVRRAELVIAARDEGASWRVIARAARRSMSRCVAIVGGG